RLEYLLGLDEAQRSAGLDGLGERGVLVREGDLSAEARESVAEAPVDGLLGGPQGGHRLAALVHIVELCAHQGTQDAAPAMRRVDADDAYTGCGKVSAGNAHVEREGRCAAHDCAVRPRGMHPVEP